MYELGYLSLECDSEYDYKSFKFTKTYMRKCVTGEILWLGKLSQIKPMLRAVL